MENTFLPGTVRQRLADIMKIRKVSQTELAQRIGCQDSTISRFISGKTDKLSDENIIRIARVFNVSTDFILGVTTVPDRKNYTQQLDTKNCKIRCSQPDRKENPANENAGLSS